MQNRTWGQLVGEARDFVLDDTIRVPTGFPTLDNALRGGLRPGHVTLFLGRTGVGKTAAVVQMTVSAAETGHPVLFASLEMGRQEVTIRALSAHMDQSVDDVEKMLASDTPAPELLESNQALKLWVCDDSTKPGWDDLEKWCETQGKKWGQHPRLVVVDHLKLMKRYGYPRGEVERVQQLAEDAKAFAKRAGVAVIAIHQAGRTTDDGSKKNHGHKPLSMEDALYGGEQDADSIMGVFRPELDPELDEAGRRRVAGMTYLQLLKNRHGAPILDGVPLRWKRPSMRFEELGRRVERVPTPQAHINYLGQTA